MVKGVTEILPGRIITKRNSVKGLLPRRESQLVPIVESALNLRNMMEKRRWQRSWPSSKFVHVAINGVTKRKQNVKLKIWLKNLVVLPRSNSRDQFSISRIKGQVFQIHPLKEQERANHWHSDRPFSQGAGGTQISNVIFANKKAM